MICAARRRDVPVFLAGPVMVTIALRAARRTVLHDGAPALAAA